MRTLPLKTLLTAATMLAVVASGIFFFFGQSLHVSDEQASIPVLKQERPLTEEEKLNVLASLSSSSPKVSVGKSNVPENQADPSDASAAEKLKILHSLNTKP